ncbi:MAG TPA: hypothetical protein VJA22_02485 [Patescibacteria group bacterium]|nr:hypothetical protein [Patescibacteria group bacterium]
MNMKAQVGIFKTKHGVREKRLFIAQWTTDSLTVPGVTIYPHPCGTCTGGDHTHIDIHQTPEHLLEVEVELSPEQVEIISAYLSAMSHVDQLTQALSELLPK